METIEHVDTERYYVPAPSWWPLIGSIALLLLASGFVVLLQNNTFGAYVMIAGALILVTMLFGWFGTVIRESIGGLFNDQVDTSYRWGMGWFIFSEVMFFGALFGALFYSRIITIPELGDTDLLWPGFDAVWPSAGPGVKEAFAPMGAWGIPAINTLILLSSGATITWAHWGLKNNNRTQLKAGLILTILLGALFIGLQIHEYSTATFTFKTGIYGATFYILTGFHGAHVTLGAIMLSVILARVYAGHFTPERHFAFEAVSWYWHFVDVVWLLLFVFVYWLV
ncbi:MFS transporter [Methylobacillus sp. MM3]|uniref:cytochrome c oxidase subunit 3 n=1 Tax=Methylobacillus sp. MM3 TaxID=1848039 RepID=UPI0007E01C12|nr:cytochrome c oxidase subunit 3 [Methylobacillus sp. MM3]OAJ70229.1 MFS transporter [Methylobacillus sp. MM3]